jgi:hypothetical protein
MRSTLSIRLYVLTLITALAALLCVLLLSGCAGPAARDGIGVPTLQLTDDAIIDSAAIGIELADPVLQPLHSEQLATFADAIASGDRERIRLDALPLWPAVREWAEAGIDAEEQSGKIGPGVAVSLRERLEQFARVLTKTAGPDP